MIANRIKSIAACLAGACVVAGVQAQQSPPKTIPSGSAKSGKTRTLEAGARLLQGNAPLRGFDIHLDGFHPVKDRPGVQMEAHHYCRQLNEDFAQCVLFDGDGSNANMTGVEYIISEKLFSTLPAAERRYWHPHNGEILSGQLVAPGIPEVAEHALMKQKINSYGKTWHTWNTGRGGHDGDRLPLGPPMLAWSFNRDGEIDPALLESRDRTLGIDTPAKRRARADLRPLAHPQQGVDALKGKFGRPTQDIPGVADPQAAPDVR